MNILGVAITGAVTLQASQPTQFEATPRQISIQANFSGATGGSTAKVWVQSSVDGGATWFDVAIFNFTTSAGIRQYNLSSSTPKTSIVTPTNGATAANQSFDGIMGPMWRTLLTTTGTYTNTTLSIDIATDQSSR